MKFIPTFTENLARYVFALNYCGRKTVIDVGCQDGHGSHIISYGANSITAVDISKTDLPKALKRFIFHCPIVFKECDFEKDFPDGEWEVAVCFEVIEHVEDGDFLVKNISEHLKSGGKFVFSVPHMIPNRFHKHLYDEKKIKDLISRHFRLDEFYVQDKTIISGKPTYKGLVGYVGVATKL